MDVILLERVENLGNIGDVATVRPGYARNFLLPRKKAVRATKANRETFEKQKEQLLALNVEKRKSAEALASSMGKLTVAVIRQAGESGALYGSVNARDIADAVKAKGFDVSRQQVAVDNPIKSIGLFPIKVSLHPEISVTVTLNVARSEEEAEKQARTGMAIVRAVAEGEAQAAAPAEAVVAEPAAEEKKPEKKARKPRKEKKEEAAE